jgi:hypothetical protein
LFSNTDRKQAAHFLKLIEISFLIYLRAERLYKNWVFLSKKIYKKRCKFWNPETSTSLDCTLEFSPWPPPARSHFVGANKHRLREHQRALGESRLLPAAAYLFFTDINC